MFEACQGADVNAWACPSCRLHTAHWPEEARVTLAQLSTLPFVFATWEEVGESAMRLSTPVPQPALACPRVSDGLYIGDLTDVEWSTMQRLEITAAVVLCGQQCSAEHRAHFGELLTHGVDIMVLSMRDRDDEDLDSYAEYVVPWVAQHVDGGKNVMVACWAGVNRSAAVIVAVLVSLWGLPLRQACESVNAQRGFTLTNRAFKRQLVEYCLRRGYAL